MLKFQTFFSKTDHFRLRAGQRGIFGDALDVIVTCAGDIVDVGGGSASLTVSRKGLDHLDPEERTSKAALQATRTAIVVSENRAVTVVGPDLSYSRDHYTGSKKKDGHPHRPRSRRGKSYNDYNL